MARYLGDNFVALASYGHVRSLPKKNNAVRPEEDFAMQYEIIAANKKHVDAIARAMQTADALYLATDPDREGEAISWHVQELLRERNALGGKPVYRVAFHEITAAAIRQAVEKPRELSVSLIDAQQARLALDYLIGFNLSPLLWKKVRGGLSAGRVQSPALRLICEREAEIEKFVAREYWTVEAAAAVAGEKFTAKLTHFDGEKLTQFAIADESRARTVEKTLRAAAAGKLTVSAVAKKQRKRNPPPPFTTSTLQQEASRKLGFSAKRTMQIAQRLYEGGGDAGGLITYMRTDSVALARGAIDEIRAVIAKKYGADAVADPPRVFKNKTKNAQEAHEAIRPTAAARSPAELKSRLNKDQLRLYELIWRRALACQMAQAVIDTVSVDLAAGAAALGHTFRATGSTVRSPGFMAVYTEGQDDKNDDKKGGNQEARLPALAAGDTVAADAIDARQHFTEPPPRYNEATLVKTLEEYGIGRPSTYASIISTLLAREYATLEQRRFEPTEIGKVVNRFLCEHFSRYVDYEFTAQLEDKLDAISRGEAKWVPVMREFWDAFSGQVAQKTDSVSRDEVIAARELGVDPDSGRPVVARMARYGPCIQIGHRDDAEKPKFAGLLPGQKLDTITLEEALRLFQLPRELGATADGERITVAIGRYGPYAKYGERKFVSLGKDHDPFTVDLPTVLNLIAEKQERDANRIIVDFADAGVQVLNGRYGPYITDGKMNANPPKDMKDAEALKNLTLEQCQELLKEGKPVRRKKFGKKKFAKKKTAKK